MKSNINKLFKTIFLLLLAVFCAISSFSLSACYEKEIDTPEANLARDIFFNKLFKIEKEVTGYKLGEGEFVNSGSVNGVEYTYGFEGSCLKIIREDGEERLLISSEFVGKNETYDKLYNVYDEIDGTAHFYFNYARFVDNKIFVIAVGNDATYSWPNMLFLYDFDNNTLKYCGHAENDRYPYIYVNSFPMGGGNTVHTPADKTYAVVIE